MHKNINTKNMSRTTLTKAKQKGKFYRTSVPQWIVKKLDLDAEKHDLLWDIDKEDGDWIIIVKPIEKEEKSD